MFVFLSWIMFHLRAKGSHRVHSPFVFKLYTKWILSDEKKEEYQTIEAIRKKLQKSSKIITRSKIGAGSKKLKKNQAQLKDVVRHGLLPEKYARLLSRLVKHFKPSLVLELGTSAGITTLYLSKSIPDGKIYTLEGNESIADVAKEIFRETNSTNISLKIGLFQDVLPNLLKDHPRIDFVFLDGDHRKDATISYIKCMLPTLHNDSVLVMDDIYWSPDMADAWEEVKQMPEVTVTIDLFRMGIVFFRKEQVKQHFTLRF